MCYEWRLTKCVFADFSFVVAGDITTEIVTEDPADADA
jgi:hypothetical protein